MLIKMLHTTDLKYRSRVAVCIMSPYHYTSTVVPYHTSILHSAQNPLFSPIHFILCCVSETVNAYMMAKVKQHFQSNYSMLSCIEDALIIHCSVFQKRSEPCHENTCLTQTWLYRKLRDCTICVENTKEMISRTVSVQLICAFI